jgi:acetoin utilization deacetylase AcuC-like enzyme
VAPALREVCTVLQPQLVFYQAGVDGLANDRLGKLKLSRNGLRQRNSLVYGEALRCGAAVVTTMGGGYGRKIEDSIAAHADVYTDLIEAFVAAA